MISRSAITFMPLDDVQCVEYLRAQLGSFLATVLPFVVRTIADQVCRSVVFGEWTSYALSNGGFFMAPKMGEPIAVSIAGRETRLLDPDEAGVHLCLNAYDRLSRTKNPLLASACLRQQVLLQPLGPGLPAMGRGRGGIA